MAKKNTAANNGEREEKYLRRGLRGNDVVLQRQEISGSAVIRGLTMCMSSPLPAWPDVDVVVDDDYIIIMVGVQIGHHICPCPPHGAERISVVDPSTYHT